MPSAEISRKRTTGLGWAWFRFLVAVAAGALGNYAALAVWIACVSEYPNDELVTQLTLRGAFAGTLACVTYVFAEQRKGVKGGLFGAVVAVFIPVSAPLAAATVESFRGHRFAWPHVAVPYLVLFGLATSAIVLLDRSWGRWKGFLLGTFMYVLIAGAFAVCVAMGAWEAGWDERFVWKVGGTHIIDGVVPVCLPFVAMKLTRR